MPRSEKSPAPRAGGDRASESVLVGQLDNSENTPLPDSSQPATPVGKADTADCGGNVSGIPNVPLVTFINTVFSDVPTDEVVLLSKQNSLRGAFSNGDLNRAKRWIRGKKGAAIYFNVSTVTRPEEGEKLRRRKIDCRATYCFVADDVGTKVDGTEVPPSWIAETSTGNFQHGYMIERTEDLARYEAFVTEMGVQGFTDPGAEGCNRLMRVPGSVNLKEGRNNFATTITDWHPERRWPLEKLAAEFGIDLNALVKTRGEKSERAMSESW